MALPVDLVRWLAGRSVRGVRSDAECGLSAYIISMANGELQSYIVTEKAAVEGGYEASNALFTPETGKRLLAETVCLISSITF